MTDVGLRASSSILCVCVSSNMCVAQKEMALPGLRGASRPRLFSPCNTPQKYNETETRYSQGRHCSRHTNEAHNKNNHNSRNNETLMQQQRREDFYKRCQRFKCDMSKHVEAG